MSTSPDSASSPKLAGGAGGAGNEPDIAAELAALREENERIRVLITARETKASVEYLQARHAARVRAWRWVAAIVVFALAAVSAPLAVVGVWSKAQVFDNDRYLATVAPLASNPGVQQAIATKITNTVFEQIDIDKVVQDGMSALVTRGVPSQLEGLAPVISNGIKSFLSEQVLKLVQSENFQKAWIAANQQAHTALVAALTGQTSSGVSVANNSVSVDMAAFIDSIKPQLVEAGIPFADKIPTVNATFVIFRGDNIGKAQEAGAYLETVGGVLPFVVLLLLLGGVLIAPGRRHGLIVAAFSLLVGMALLAVALALARGWYVSSLPAGVLDAQTAGQVFDTVAVQMMNAIRAVCVLAIVVIIAVLLAGPSRAAVWIRHLLGVGSDRIRKALNRQDMPPNAAELFVGKYRRALEWAVVIILFALIFLTSQPTVAYIIWMSVLALVLVVAVELFGLTDTEGRVSSGETPTVERAAEHAQS